MHHDFGPWARLLVNRDSTFLALAGVSGAPSQTPATRITTCCNPLATPKPIADQGRHIEYAADITLCALGIKLQDDASDEGWARGTLAKVGRKSLEPAIDKAIARLNSTGFPTAEVADTILSQNAIEADSPDALTASQPTAHAYGKIFQKHPGEHHPAWQQIGSSLGRLIYWDDAWRDWTRDLRKGRFNPLSQTPAPELRELIAHEFSSFQSQLSALPASPAKDTLLLVANQTQSQVPLANETPEQAEKKRKRHERDARGESKWYDWCCHCDCGDCSTCSSCSKGARCGKGSNSTTDACFDCGPGDSGCIDCCPCDGCDCCP